MRQPHALVFDLGGTHLRCGFSGPSGELSAVRKLRIESFLHEQSSDLIWKRLLSQMISYDAMLRDLAQPNDPIVVSFPGPVCNGNQILDAPTVVGEWRATPDLVLELSSITGRQVYLLNDLSAAAWYFSSRVPVERFMVITVSSGIGSKIFDRRHPDGVLDKLPYSGEIGHIVVDDNADSPKCDCGGKGHLGAIASGRGIEGTARRLALREPEAFARSACVTRFGASSQHITNEAHLVPAALQRDPWAIAVIRTCTKPLARIALSVVLGAGLERIVIIGGFALRLGTTYLEILRSAISEISQYRVLSQTLSDLVQLGDPDEEACLRGAAVFATEKLPGLR